MTWPHISRDARHSLVQSCNACYLVLSELHVITMPPSDTEAILTEQQISEMYNDKIT